VGDVGVEFYLLEERKRLEWGVVSELVFRKTERGRKNSLGNQIEP